jgi:hypothetical protein
MVMVMVMVMVVVVVAYRSVLQQGQAGQQEIGGIPVFDRELEHL